MKNMNPCNNLCAPPPPNAAAFSSGSHRRTVIVNGPVIVGAGPSGLAVAACLRRQGVPFVIVERANCIASLWQNRTYDRLSLHLPKQFCQLPHFPFPETFPEYPSRTQFLDYLHSYAAKFHIRPQFGESVTRAEPYGGLWRVATSSSVSDGSPSETEYLCRWLVVATGENAEKVVPEIEGARNFGGPSIHACDYKSGKAYEGKRVLVVGCGNSGMEVSLDLANHGALPSMLVRSSVHVLPREILGRSTYEVARVLTKWVPVWVVDKILVAAARLILGQTEEYGLRRPGLGPMELKQTEGKTPVLDIGAVEKIRSGGIKVVPAGIKKFSTGAVELDNGEILRVDSVVYATGYSSNVPYWLKGCDFFSKDGFPRSPFPNGWKGENGIYAAGFGRKGLLGASVDASKIAEDIGEIWRRETGLKHNSIGVKFNKKF